MRKIFKKIIQYWRHFLLKNQASIHSSAVIHKSAKIINLQKNKDKIIIGANVQVRGELLIYAHGGKIEIGNDCYIGEGTKIWSSEFIKIGNKVLISHNVNIHDSNSHPIDALERHQHFLDIIGTGHPSKIDLNEKKVMILDNVWIGFNSTILKGVVIGEKAIVAACSVVTKSVCGNSIIGSEPAKVIKKFK